MLILNKIIKVLCFKLNQYLMILLIMHNLFNNKFHKIINLKILIILNTLEFIAFFDIYYIFNIFYNLYKIKIINI